MKNILNKRIRFIGIVIGAFLAINVALSFAYIRGGSVGSESVSTIALTGGSVNVRYSGGDVIVANSIVPGYETTKQFTITSDYGEGHEYYNLGLWYQINLVVDKNEFGDGSLTYSLSLDAASDDDGVPATDVEYIPIPSGQNLTGIIVGTGKLDNDNKSHVYNLKITYAETSTDQSEEIGSKFEAHITLTNPKIARIIFDLNGGTYTSSTTKYIPLGMAVSIEEPTKEGYTFNGWKITSGDGTVSGNTIIANSLAITVQAQYKVPDPVNFASDSWATIAANVQAKKEATKSVYSVGSEKEVAIGGTNYTVRIANNSNYDCSLESKTACGFVVEFVDIVEKRAMNSSNTNAGGWPATAMRTYLNGTFKSKLPSDLQSVIADTTVVSGHGSTSGETNFTSTDKIYLLSTREVWVDGSSSPASSYDTAYNSTRQLDYYANNSVTTSNYGGAVKKYNGSASSWWLRGAAANYSSSFRNVYSDGSRTTITASYSGGVAPAFRIE